MTTSQLASAINKSYRTVQRHISDINRNDELLAQLNNGNKIKAGLSDDLPDSVCNYIKKEKSSQGAGKSTKNGFKADESGRNVTSIEISGSFPDKKVVLSVPDKNDIAPNPKAQKMSSILFVSDKASIAMAVILVCADSFSCGWIASLAFENFTFNIGFIGVNPASIFFACVGFAVAFASIRNAILFTGWDSDKWLTWFGIVQFGLHSAAFELFGDYSLIVGKWVMCVCIPLATIGIAITWKTKK